MPPPLIFLGAAPDSRNFVLFSAERQSTPGFSFSGERRSTRGLSFRFLEKDYQLGDFLFVFWRKSIQYRILVFVSGERQ